MSSTYNAIFTTTMNGTSLVDKLNSRFDEVQDLAEEFQKLKEDIAELILLYEEPKEKFKSVYEMTYEEYMECPNKL